ncbi:MAG: CRISPR-associated helicase/endonuclease Cas3, partial [Clostridiales bacterium]|nr:CRISPR-associated helicase/endonuclease Cas3 [Clostridiales bacterium]
AKGLLGKYPDISAPECIREYYARLLFMDKDEIQKNAMHNRCALLESIPFKSYAEDFEMIDTKTVSLVVERDEKSRKLINAMHFGSKVSVRELQNYTCTLYRKRQIKGV